MRWLGLLLTGCVSLGAGFAAGWLGRGAPEAPRRVFVPSGSPVALEEEAAPPEPPLPQKELLAALRTAADTSDLDTRNELLSELLQRVAPDDYPAALTEAQRVPNLHLRQELIESLILRWADTEPEAALSHAHDLTPPALARSAALRAIEVWSGHDAASAAAWLEHLPEEDRALRRDGISTLVPMLAESDPARALSLASKAGMDASSAVRSVMWTWGRNAPERAVEAYERLPGGRSKQEALDALVNGWSETDPMAAMKWGLGQTDAGTRLDVLRSALGQCAMLDPAAAVRSLAELPEREQSEMTGVVAGAWADADLEGAMGWAKSLRDPAQRGTAYSALLYRLSETDPERAFGLVAELPEDQRRDAAVNIAATMGSSDPVRAFERVQKLPEGEMRGEALSATVASWAELDPQAAANAANTMSGQARGDALAAVGRAWVTADPRRGAAWLESRSTDDRDAAVSSAIGALTLEDPDTAKRLALSIKGDDAREGAVYDVASMLADESPRGAAEWVLSTPASGPPLQYILDTWRTRAPEEFAAWSAHLSGDAAQRVQASLDVLDGVTPEDAADEDAPEGSECHCTCPN